MKTTTQQSLANIALDVAITDKSLTCVEPLIRELSIEEIMLIGGGECLVNGL